MSQADAENILEVSSLRCSIAGQQVVEDVTFSVPATGITAILGPQRRGQDLDAARHPGSDPSPWRGETRR